MQTAIEEIYESAWELLEDLPTSEEHKAIQKKVEALHNALEQVLTETQIELLNELCFTMWEMETSSNKNHFITGFNYGVKIVTQALK